MTETTPTPAAVAADRFPAFELDTPPSPWRWLHLAWIIPAWLLQYTLVVPTVWVWRYLVVPAFKVGFIGIVLLCIPIVGWVLLAVLIFRRKAPVNRSHAYLKPWGAALLR